MGGAQLRNGGYKWTRERVPYLKTPRQKGSLPHEARNARENAGGGIKKLLGGGGG